MCQDINGEKRALTKLINYPFDRFSNKDIIGTQSSPKHLKTKRETNPLNPNYCLQPVGELDVFVPKYLKDPLEIKDIDGTHGRRKIHEKELNKTNFIDDIEFSRPAKEKKPEVLKNIMETEDINLKHKRVKYGSRNPLNPEYLIKVLSKNEIHKIGEIEKNTTKILHRNLNVPHYNLKTHDIEGTQVASAGNKWFKEPLRREFLESNKVSDILGSQPNTRKKGLSTKRITNPIDPDYSLDERRHLTFKGELEGEE